jgi:hypothetical protein
MSLERRIAALGQLKQVLLGITEQHEIIYKASSTNPFFEPVFTIKAIRAVANELCDAGKLRTWTSHYNIEEDIKVDKTIGLICAGNIPLVGFHDFLCCYITGARIKIKLSSKDDVLFLFALNTLGHYDTGLKDQMAIVERLEGFDAVIATGSNNTNRYFEYYFRSYPKILRRNRNSLAVLTGSETGEELAGLASDIFDYFGLGCRSVSSLLLPVGYDLTTLFPHFSAYAWLHNHSRYMNNYDYNRTIYLLNADPHLANEFVMVLENKALASVIGTLHYQYYTSLPQAEETIQQHAEEIQCVVAAEGILNNLPQKVNFGKAQQPTLSDYADGVDTMQFLLSL